MEAPARGRTYKIGQAAKLLDVKPFVLRFWETEFKDVLVPVRTPSGQRAYTEANVELVRQIKRLLYDEGLTIEGAKKRLAQGAKPKSAQPAPRQSAPAQPPVQAAPARQAELAAAPGPDATQAAAQAAAPLAETLALVARELQALRDLLD